MAVSVETTGKAKTSTFPQHELGALLQKELMEAAQVEADMNGFTLPEESSVAMVAPIPMDSLVIVDLLCSVVDVLGFQPKPATVRTGGYDSMQDALDHLMPRLEKQWQKEQGGG